jgi:hypothetical protein
LITCSLRVPSPAKGIVVAASLTSDGPGEQQSLIADN